jgi:hypothetical protein
MRLVTRQGPLAGKYSAVAAMVVTALIPYLVLSAALQPVMPIIAGQLHMSTEQINLAGGLANAGYALGTVLSVQLAQHLPQRPGRPCSSRDTYCRASAPACC